MNGHRLAQRVLGVHSLGDTLPSQDGETAIRDFCRLVLLSSHFGPVANDGVPAFQLRRAEEEFIPQSTRAVCFKRVLGCPHASAGRQDLPTLDCVDDVIRIFEIYIMEFSI